MSVQHPFLPSSSLLPAPWELCPPMAIHPSIHPALASFPGWVLWDQGPVGRSHEPTALHASWERGCPRVNGACVVVQAGSQGARGSGPIPVLTCTMTFRASLRPSLLRSISSPEHWGMGGWWWWWYVLVYVPRRGNVRKWVLPPPAPAPGTLSASGKLLSPVSQKGPLRSRDRRGTDSPWAGGDLFSSQDRAGLWRTMVC